MAETLGRAYATARKRLRATSASPDLDARLLLQHVTGLDHAGFVLETERALSAGEADQFERFLLRRLNHEPVSRILGWREFYGRRFAVTPDVLDPRADTESLVELALTLCTPPPKRILDIGSGSGAIIVSLLAEWPGARGVAVDISTAALEMTQRNAAALGVASRLTCLEGSIFAPVSGRFDLIVSNPPYIPAADVEALAPDVRAYDPHLALDGGTDGLSAYRIIAAGAAAHLEARGLVVVEIGCGQQGDVKAVFSASGMSFVKSKHDLAGVERALAFVCA
ncbi:MAG: peptide chain release factor N(5)-glutamine methyltransferase [Proteobacteria bacterium]|nr:peptide chain release factor N(5)-glutamine methyltransferase [Pseudomonadota bacterium]